jgi:hypothetical protein
LLDEVTRSAILRLREAGHGTRSIANALGISRDAVRDVVKSGTAEVPRLVRTELADGHREQILELFATCKGNLVRVHEELVAGGASLSYQALTAFCRRHEIGRPAKPPVGHREFMPGDEMQQDTSPHQIKIKRKLTDVQTASLVLPYSRVFFFQHYLRFTRFECKVFTHDALTWLKATGRTCMIDNTHVVVLRGTGKNMVPVPEMASFAERYGFQWVAHEIGDSDRKPHVEKRFHFIENNFHAGREWDSLEQSNVDAIAWCEKVAAAHNSKLHASPRELFALELTKMEPLPIFMPEPYQLHHRIVDVEGYVSVHGVRYSAPYKLIGKRLEARETKDKIEVFDGPRSVAVHEKLFGGHGVRATLPEHRPPRGVLKHEASAEERALAASAPEVAQYAAALKKRGHGLVAQRRLVRMLRDYPENAVTAAVETAAQFGLFDLERVERMVLKNVGHDFFPSVLRRLHDDDKDNDDDG